MTQEVARSDCRSDLPTYLKTAQALGINVPNMLIVRADEVID
jgi:hypothetical protein